jgi:hypothetical protein
MIPISLMQMSDYSTIHVSMNGEYEWWKTKSGRTQPTLMIKTATWLMPGLSWLKVALSRLRFHYSNEISRYPLEGFHDSLMNNGETTCQSWIVENMAMPMLTNGAYQRYGSRKLIIKKSGARAQNSSFESTLGTYDPHLFCNFWEHPKDMRPPPK